MPDTFTQVTSTSWFSRIGGAFKGIVFGIILFLAAFPLLFWNEGRAVKAYKTLKEGQQAVVTVASDRVDAGNEGKLIHVTGQATTAEVLTDPLFGVSANALKFKRVVEYYQWKETQHSETHKKLGGGTETTTTYEYQKVWTPDPINSSAFKSPTGHENTTGAIFDPTTLAARKITFGAFRLSQSLLNQINNYTAVPVAADAPIPASLKDKVRLSGTGFYAGKEPTAPQIGDARITFTSVLPTEVSVVSRQVSDTFEPYTAKTGKALELLEIGAHSAEEMFQTARTHNKIFTWVLRAVGFFMMLFGLAAILRPITVLADVIPFLGSLAEAGTFFIAFIIAASLSLITIATAWIVYRPLLGIVLIAAAVGLTVVITRKLKKPAVTSPIAAP